MTPLRFHRRAAKVAAMITVSAIASFAPADRRTYAQQAPASPVVVAPVVSQQITATQTFVGTVMPVKTATIGSAVAGRVVEFPVEEGDRVEAGQKLAQLLTATIALEVEAAEAELKLKKSRYDELKAGSRPEEIEQARSRMAAAKANQTYNEARRKRIEQAYQSQGVVTEEELEEAISAEAGAKEAYLEAKAAHAMAVEGPRKEVVAQAAAEVEMQAAIVEQLKDRMKKYTVITRFAGYVVAEHTEEGQWVNQGDPVAEVIAIDQVEVVAQVVEGNVPFVHTGRKVDVEIPAFPGRTFEGTVTKSAPRGDTRARTFPIKVLVDNEITDDGPLLKAGMYARVSLPVGRQQQATMVPKDAIVLGGAQPVLFVVDGVSRQGSTGQVRPVPVKLGNARGEWIQATGELADGQMVVVEGNERLRPQQPVVISRILATGQ